VTTISSFYKPGVNSFVGNAIQLAQPGAPASAAAIFAGTGEGWTVLPVARTSGHLTVPAGAAKATQSGVRFAPGACVLATLQHHNPGVTVEAVTSNIAAGSFTIHLSHPLSTNTEVAWFVIN
jgi:hypothetical protein